MTVRVRRASPAEAAILAEMANDLNDHVGIHGRPFTPGYAFFSAGYNTDVAARSIFLHDLFVAPRAPRSAMYPSDDVDPPVGRRYHARDGKLRDQNPALQPS